MAEIQSQISRMLTYRSYRSIWLVATTTLFNQVLSALSSNDEVRLQQIFNDLSLRIIDSLRKLKAGEHFSQIGKFLFEIFVPKRHTCQST